MNTIKTILTLALTTVVGAAGPGLAADNPFGMQSPASGYTVVAADAAKPMEGKCGASKEAKPMEGKCGADMKATETKCGADMAGKPKDGKCGEGKCGAGKKAPAAKCGGMK